VEQAQRRREEDLQRRVDQAAANATDQIRASEQAHDEFRKLGKNVVEVDRAAFAPLRALQ
jgi:hypothetical protein